MDLQRILVAVDSLHARDAAFARALALARTFGAELYLLHAVPVNERFSFRAAERLAQMEEMRTRAEDAGVAVRTVEQHGDAAETIELHANARAVNLIVMGGKPRGGWRQRWSTVAERVIRRTNVPTLVVASDRADEPSAFRRVLAAVDMSSASERLVGDAVALTAHEAAHVTVLHAVAGLEPFGAVRSPARWVVPEYRTHVVERARRYVEDLASQLPGRVDSAVKVVMQPAARAILEHAAAMDADLVVMGRSRGFTLLGSTALRVLRKNDRALLVVPDAAAARQQPIDARRAA